MQEKTAKLQETKNKSYGKENKRQENTFLRQKIKCKHETWDVFRAYFSFKKNAKKKS